MDLQGHYHYVATFAGFVPAEQPELSVIVVIDEPDRPAILRQRRVGPGLLRAGAATRCAATTSRRRGANRPLASPTCPRRRQGIGDAAGA